MAYGVAWVHGIGPTKRGYSKQWVKVYNPYLHFTPPADAYLETFWADVFRTPSEVEATRVANALKTIFFARATAQRPGPGLLGEWSEITQKMATGAETVLDWVVNPDAFVGEFVKYLVDGEIRARVKGEVKAQLSTLLGSGRTCSIIAVSWGSVVAYESLLDLEREQPAFEVAHLFTIASPLWLVQYLLEDPSGRKPGKVANWVNIHAQGDLIGAGLTPGFQVDADYAVASFGDGDPHTSYFVVGNVAVQRDIVAATILGSPSEGPH